MVGWWGWELENGNKEEVTLELAAEFCLLVLPKPM